MAGVLRQEALHGLEAERDGVAHQLRIVVGGVAVAAPGHGVRDQAQGRGPAAGQHGDAEWKDEDEPGSGHVGHRTLSSCYY